MPDVNKLPRWTASWIWSQFLFGWIRMYYDGNHDIFHFGFLQIEYWH